MAFSVLDQKAAGSTGGASVSLTIDSTQDGGADAILVAVAYYSAGGANTIPTDYIQDDESNTYTRVADNHSETAIGTGVALFLCVAPVNDATLVITGSNATSFYASIGVMLLQHADQDDAFDQAASTYVNGDRYITPGPITPASAGSLVVMVNAQASASGLGAVYPGEFTYTNTAGFDFVQYSGSNHFYLSVGYVVQTSAVAAPSAHYDSGTGSQVQAAIVASFNLAVETAFTLTAASGTFAVTGSAATLAVGSGEATTTAGGFSIFGGDRILT